MTKRLTVYWLSFGCLLAAAACLAMGGVTRTLGTGFSLSSIALSTVALVLGVVSLRR